MRTTGRVVVVGSSIIKLQEDLKPDHALPNQLHRALLLLDELGATALANQLRDPERAQSGFVAVKELLYALRGRGAPRGRPT